MSSRDCNDPMKYVPVQSLSCCPTQTNSINSVQLAQLIHILAELIRIIPVFFAEPTLANQQIVVNVCMQLLAVLDSLIPSTEINYIKQLIQAILNLLQLPPARAESTQSATSDVTAQQLSTAQLGQLYSLLQQLYSALAAFFFSLIIDSSTLQTLLRLLVPLIGVTPVVGIAGTTGPQGVQGLQGPLSATGPQGIQGAFGVTGPTGPIGLQGNPGIQGMDHLHLIDTQKI